MAARLRIALDAGLSVAAYHLPLDAHPEIGNNALLCDRLGFEPDAAAASARSRGGRSASIGRIRDGIEAAALIARVEEACDREPLRLRRRPGTRCARSASSRGAGASEIHDAVELGLDAFLTGEPAEHAMADAREGGLHFIAAGHYATETIGIRRLGELAAERFGWSTSSSTCPTRSEPIAPQIPAKIVDMSGLSDKNRLTLQARRRLPSGQSPDAHRARRRDAT